MKTVIENGKAFLGVELGSTRVKAVLIDEHSNPIASGDAEWENALENGYWTYPLDLVVQKLQESYKSLRDDVRKKYGVEVKSLAGMGVSAMMHGYLPFDKGGNLLAAFRTWRNTTTEKAASVLSKEFQFNVPQRWSVSHLYQAVLNGEKHVGEIAFLTTLSGFVHWKLTGEKVLGIGDASGMFPIDSAARDYNDEYAKRFDKLLKEAGVNLGIKNILPKVLSAGEDAGVLTEEGARLLDPSGNLQAGVPVCPPEGDAGTGMVATNSVSVGTGNVSAGTSIFSMIVLENSMKNYYSEIDMVTTPSGNPVAMVHCNNCTNEINAWFSLFDEVLQRFGKKAAKSELYDALFFLAESGDVDCSMLVNVPFLSGEPVLHVNDAILATFRNEASKFSLANFVRSLIYSAFATLKIGNDILMEREHVKVDVIYGHGGIFKTKGVAQKILANALNCKVSCMETAGEGGAWGMAILAAFAVLGKGKTLEKYLEKDVFSAMKVETEHPDAEGAEGFAKYAAAFKKKVNLC